MAASRPHREPGPEHPITMEATGKPVAVRLGGDPVARAKTYLELREADYPPVAYIPREAADPDRLAVSDTTSWCPYKGEATYFHLRGPDGELIRDAAWSYETPFPAVAAIARHLAFYPDKVDSIDLG